jgi:hypothetical protein
MTSGAGRRVARHRCEESNGATLIPARRGRRMVKWCKERALETLLPRIIKYLAVNYLVLDRKEYRWTFQLSPFHHAPKV